MDDRTSDLEQHIRALEEALQAGNPGELLARALAAELALEFRTTDAMTGLPPVDDGLIVRTDALVEQALQATAEAGLVAAQSRLGRRLLEQDKTDAALDQLTAAAAQGDVDAAQLAAVVIWEDRILERAEQAVAVAQRAAPGDATGSCDHLLGLFSFHGFGTAEDHARSLAHREAAARKGHADGMFELYAMLSQGLGRAASPDEAVGWCVRAAEAGSMRAMYNLGAFHATGRGVPQDLEASVRWYDGAARGGHGRAAATLGVMYALGQGVPRDEEQAREYFLMADASDFDWRVLAVATGVDVLAYDTAMGDDDDDLDDDDLDDDDLDDDDLDDDDDDDDDDDEGEQRSH